MNIIESEQFRKKLTDEYKENCANIDDLDNKIYLLKKSSFKNKVIKVFLMSFIPCIANIFVCSVMKKNGLIQLELFNALSVGVPLTIGVFSKKLLEKNDILKDLSNSKNQKQKYEEEVKYSIEMDKLKTSNKIINKVSDDLKSWELMSVYLSNQYNNTSKDKDEITKNDLTSSVENIQNLLKEKKEELDIATTRKTLYNFREMANSDDIMDSFGLGFYTCLILYVISMSPIMIANQITIPGSLMNFFGVLFAPAIVGGLVCAGYRLKERSNQIKAFKKINIELGDSKITSEKQGLLDKNYENQKDKIINEEDEIINIIYTVRIQLENEIRKLESLNNDIEKMSEDEHMVVDHVIPDYQTSIISEQEMEVISEEKNPVLKKTIFDIK